MIYVVFGCIFSNLLTSESLVLRRVNTVEEPSIIAGLFQDVAWIRVVGKGTFRNAPQLKAFARHRIEEGQVHLVVDLEDCPYMDSTFMGTLTGIALLLKGKPDGRLQVVNSNERTTKSLLELGLDQILELDLNGSVWTDVRELVRTNVTQNLEAEHMPEEESRQLVLEAHEALCKANQENIARFRDVLEYLKQSAETQESV